MNGSAAGAPSPANHADLRVRQWIALLVALIASMVLIGGITRLTDSGLSIVEWKPIHGAIPPLNADEWLEEFKGYQTTTQFQVKFPNMTLNEFKWIFFWEYLHRLIGRLLGLAFLFPWIYFTLKKRIQKAHQAPLIFSFLLGGAQGFLGWYMVKSGLADQPYVSHLRLAAHLGLALFLLVFLLHLHETMRVRSWAAPSSPSTWKNLRRAFYLCWIFLAVQIFFGALVAGLKAGYLYTTYPWMNGQWIPPGFWLDESVPTALAAGGESSPWIRNLFFNPVLIQWIHRWWGASVALSLLAWGGQVLRQLQPHLNESPPARRLKFWVQALLVGILAQFGLGVLTLISEVHLPLAVVHQSGATLLLVVFAILHRALPTPR